MRPGRSLARTAGLAAALLCASLPTAPAWAQSNDATLSALAVTDNDGNAVALSPAFASGTDTYTASVADIVWRVTVTPTPNEANATTEYRVGDAAFADVGTAGFRVNLDVGQNVIMVRVTAQDGNTTQTYQVTVSRGQYMCEAPELSDDELELVAGTMTVGVRGTSSGFDRTIDPEHWYGELSNRHFTSDGFRNSIEGITYDGTDGVLIFFTFDGVQEFDALRLHICGETFDVQSADATDADLEARWATDDPLWSRGIEISVVLSRTLSSDAALSGLELLDRTGNAIALSTAFAFHETVYTASVVNSVSRITITPTARDRRATIRYLDGHGNALADRDTFTAGRQIDLEEGTNTIQVEVTAENGVTVQTYSVEVTRARQSDADATLQTLQLSEGVLSPAFASDETVYAASVPNFASEITVTAVKTDSAATVDFLDGDRNALADTDTVMEGHQAELEVGANTIQVAVTAGNGVTTKIYVLTVTRAVQSNTDATLRSLTVERLDGQLATLSPAFDPDTLDYALVVRYTDAGTLTVALSEVIPRTADPAAIVEFKDFFAADDEEYEVVPEEGFQRGLNSEHAAIRLRVTAGDGMTRRTYTLTPDVKQQAIAEFRCEIPDLTNRVEVWSAAMNVQKHPLAGSHGWISDFMGHLSDASFEYRGTSYDLYSVVDNDSVLEDSLVLLLDEGFPLSGLDGLRLHACGDTFELAESIEDDIGDYGWNNAGLDWSDATTVLLALSEEQFPPVFEDAENDALYARVVTENSPPGTSIGAPVTATDINGDTLAYSLEGIDAWRFEIDRDTGQLRTRAGVDYSVDHVHRMGSYLFRVVAKDGRGGTAKVDVEVYAAFAVDRPLVRSAGDVILSVMWTEPSIPPRFDVDDAGLEYDVRYRQEGTSAWSQVTTGDTSSTINLVEQTSEEIDPGLSYEAQVRAHFTSGIRVTGAWSESGFGSTGDAASGRPGISGTAQAGRTLTADTDSVTDRDGTSRADNGESGYAYAYEWIRVTGSNETPIAGATSNTYRLTSDDVGERIGVRVRFTDDDDNRERVTSHAVGPVGSAEGACLASPYWCTDLVVGLEPGQAGASTGYRGGAAGYGMLVDDTVEHGGKSYTVESIVLDPGAGARTVTVEVSGGRLPADSEFRLGNKNFETDDATEFGAGGYRWDAPEDLVWAHGNTVRVSARLGNFPATGKPAIRGAARVGEELRATTSGIMDYDGKQQADNADYWLYQWVRTDGRDERLISGASESTYTLTDADLGKKVRVYVEFPDDLGNGEGDTDADDGHLASDAYPAGYAGVRGRNDATLRSLVLTDGGGAAVSLSPPFVPMETTYTASVENVVRQVTLAATKNEPNAMIAYLDGAGAALDDADDAAGFQVRLGLGDNVIRVKVTAQDDTVEQTYQVTVNREGPAVGMLDIRAGHASIGGGLEDLEFTLVRGGAATAEQQVTVTLTQEEDWLAAADLTQTETFGVGEDTMTLTIAAEKFSFDPDVPGILTATVSGGGSPSDTVKVISTPDPALTIGYEKREYTFREDDGGAVVYWVARLDPAYPRPPSRSQRVSFITGSDSAESISDYRHVSDERETSADLFERDAVAGQFVARVAVDGFGLVDDDVYEGAERFEMLIQASPGTLEDIVQFEKADGTTCHLDSCSEVAYPVFITDEEDLPEWLVSAAPMTIAEEDDSATTDVAENVSTLTVGIVDGLFAADQRFTLAFSGSAAFGTDYTVSPADAEGGLDEEEEVIELPGHQVLLPAGRRSVEVTVTAAGNDTTDGNRSVDVSVALGERHIGTATVTILDDETTSANNPATGKPGIVGTAQVGRVLTAALGTVADPDGLPSDFPSGYTFQWVRVDAMANETVVGVANTYRPTVHDSGATIVLRVSFTDNAGNREERASDATAMAVALSCESNAVWCTTLVVGGVAGRDATGYCGSGAGTDTCDYGSLKDDGFTLDTTDYTVESVRWSTKYLHLTMDGDFPSASLANLTLQIGTSSYALSDANRTVGDADNNYAWFGYASGLRSLPVNTAITVQLLSGAPMPSSVATLSALVLTEDGGTTVILNPEFASGTPIYTASVENPVKQVRVTPVPTHRNSRVRYRDADTGAASFDVGLRVGNNDIEVKVTAEDQFTTQTYRALVERANAPAEGKPGIDGTPQVGQRLEATKGNIDDADGLPPGTFPAGYAFQWLSVFNGTATEIGGATASTYTPTAADIGKAILVEVTFTDGGETDETLSSDATGAVLPAPESCAQRAHNDWCAQMTVGVVADVNGTRYGYAEFTFGQLDDTTVDYGPSWVVRGIGIDEVDMGDATVGVELDALAPRGSVFDLGGTTFAADSTSEVAGEMRYSWDRPAGFAWIDGQWVTVSANIAPPVESARADGTSLVLTYYEDLDGTSVPGASAYAVDADGTAVTVTGVAVDGKEVTLTLMTAIAHGQTVTVDYTAPSSNAVRDVSALDAPSFSGQEVNTVDTTAPSPESAAVPAAGRPLSITFDEELDIGEGKPLPPADAFTVTLDDSEAAVNSVGILATDGLSLSLSATVKQGQTVTVSYEVPATGAIRDPAGNVAEAFADLAVDNNSTVVDARGAVLEPDALEVDEGATASYTVALTEAPTGRVTVTVGVQGAGVTLSVTSLAFTPMDWDDPARVEVTAHEDEDAEDETVRLTHEASGGGYDGVSLPDLEVTVADNDGGVVADPTELTVVEGGDESYGLKLTRRPTSDVTVTVTVTGDAGKVTAVPASLTFTVDDWDMAKTVTVSGDQDGDKNDETVTLAHAATGGGYAVEPGDARSAPVKVTVQDDEATAPGAPELEAGAGNGTALLRWTPPDDDGGAPVTGYEYRLGEGEAQAADSLTGHTVRGLANGTEYRFRLRAVNRVGEGPWSDEKTVVPVPLRLTVEADRAEVKEGEPVVYRIVMSEPTGWVTVGELYRYEGEFMRSSPSSSGGGIRSQDGVLAWEVELATVDDNVIEAHGSFTVTLEPGDGYALGTPSSATVRIMDNDGGASPGEPSGLTVSTVSPTMLEATWRAAAANGAPLTGYEVEYRAGTIGQWSLWPESIDTAARSARLTGLSPGTAYQVRVRARNVRGEGPWSTPGAAETAPDPGVEVSIERGPRTVKIEGATLLFTVRASPAQSAALRVDIRVTETVDTLAAGAPTSVTVPAERGSVELEVRTLNDEEDEGDSEVTAELQPSVRYVLGDARAATYTVYDDEDDDPERGAVLRPSVETILDPRTPEYVQAEAEEPIRVLRFAWDPPSDVALAHVHGWEVQWAEVASCSEPHPPPEETWPGRGFWLVEELERIRGGTEVLRWVREAAHFRVRAQLVGTKQLGPWSEPVCSDMADFESAPAVAAATSGPSVTSVAVEADPDGDGLWSPGEAVTVTFVFSEAVTVRTAEGTPSVSLLAGGAREAVYSGGTGTAALRFVYEVTAADGTVSLVLVPENALTLNGGAIEGPTGLAAALAHAGAGRAGTAGGASGGTPSPKFSVADASATEGGTLAFAVTLDPAASITVWVDWETADGTAKAGEDYEADSGRLVFAPGETEKTVRVAVLADGVAEGAETMELRLSNATGAALADAEATGTVSDPAGPPPEIAIADAKVEEGPGAVLEFAVTLDPASQAVATVDWETRDGNALAGEDYEAGSGRLEFAPGETAKTIRVAVLDDSHDEGRQVMLVVLSNPVGATLAKSAAGGTIENADPMPRAWLARFGRAASVHTADAIRGRLAGGERQARGNHFTVGGRRLDTLFDAFRSAAGDAGKKKATKDVRLEPESAWARMDRMKAEAMGWSTAYGEDGVVDGGMPRGLRPAGPAAGGIGPAAGRPGPATVGPGSAGGAAQHRGPSSNDGGSAGLRQLLSTALPSAVRPFADLLDAGRRDGRGLLLGSSFDYSGGLGDGTANGLSGWSAWGRGAQGRFRGADGPLSIDGEVATATVGADAQWGRWLAGVAVSHSWGEGVYRHATASGGDVTSRLTGVNPYARFDVSERLSLWGTAGYGAGELRLLSERAENAIETGLESRMAAFGGRGVFARRGGGFELAVVSDALYSGTVSEAATELMGTEGASSRVRLMLEGSGSMTLSNGAVLRPTLEAGLRVDGGDAETGAGVEIGGGLAWSAGRLSVEMNARGLLAHEDAGYREWGFGGSVKWRPNEDGRGWAMDVGSSWGAVRSGVRGLWSQADASGLARGGAMNASQRFQGQLGYGLSGRKGRALWVPFFATEASAGQRAYRMGLKLSSGPNLEAGLELGRRTGTRGAAEDAIRLRGAMRW